MEKFETAEMVKMYREFQQFANQNWNDENPLLEYDEDGYPKVK